MQTDSSLSPKTIHPVDGIRLGTADAGIRKGDGDDVMLVELTEGCNVAAVFTRNAFCAAPVHIARKNLSFGHPRFLLVNSGNANAGTGTSGMTDAEASCDAVAQVSDCDASDVLPFSTGVIGEPLPVEKIVSALPAAFSALSPQGWEAGAQAIMTTDTFAKVVSQQVEIDGHCVTITGMSKGAGMICPDMATMLAYIATDASIGSSLLQTLVQSAADQSFNRITIDGDTSTNDACVLIATGRSSLPEVVDATSVASVQLTAAITQVFEQLAQLIVRDGEGATKFVTVEVGGGADARESLDVAYTIAHSPLVKTALFGSDPNWGRILAAIGRAGIESLDIDKVVVHLGEVCIVRNGGRNPDYEEAMGQAVMAQRDISIRVNLGRGDSVERVWTSDLSYDYVKINAEYRT